MSVTESLWVLGLTNVDILVQHNHLKLCGACRWISVSVAGGLVPVPRVETAAAALTSRSLTSPGPQLPGAILGDLQGFFFLSASSHDRKILGLSWNFTQKKKRCIKFTPKRPLIVKICSNSVKARSRSDFQPPPPVYPSIPVSCHLFFPLSSPSLFLILRPSDEMTISNPSVPLGEM